MQGLRLRVKDIDFEQKRIIIRDTKRLTKMGLPILCAIVLQPIC